MKRSGLAAVGGKCDILWLLAWKSSSGCSLFRKSSVRGEGREPQVLGWEYPLTSFDCLRRRIEDISCGNCSGIA